MKKILYLHAGAEMYGADKVLLELVSGIDKSKFECTIVLPNDGVLVKAMKKKGLNVSIIPYPILRRKIFSPIGIIKYAFEYFKYSLMLIKLIKKYQIDIIHINTTAVLEGILIKIITRKKVLWHVHEIITQPKFIYKIISFLVNKFSDKAVAVSKATKEHLINSGLVDRKKVSVIYNGVDGEVYSPFNPIDYLYSDFNIPTDSIVVGMIGRVNSWKGQKDFILAMEPLMKENKKIYAVLVGGVFEDEYHFMDDLKQIIQNSKFEERFIVSDFRDDIANIHNFFDIFVLPSTSPDPLPTVVLESMASGKPVVGYRHGGVTEMVVENQNGLLANPNSPKDLGNKIQQLIIDTNKRKKFGENSLERQKKFFDKKMYIYNFENKYGELEG
ncbi:glycosyltransferase family 4 protein [Enterococcus hermanniensis]|uniref:Glycosyltransferase n=1 Tax=Enterococcus hermanniensis TaxID=249189 RepID=A0A1L8TRX5_9ENTE|nr:glycosyltransferase family 4 protein [Enterococcus hermanniensis]OJG47081.1 glycosyltransferase [Enterococcus hermanniensis]